MKKLFLLFTAVFLSTMVMAIDCSRSGQFVKPSDITISGTVTVKLNENNQVVIEFSSDFKTDAGPDLDVYLSSTSSKNANSLNVHALNSLSGAQTYVVNDVNVNMSSYNYVIVHCTQYNHHYGYVMLGALSGNDCASLGVKETEQNIFGAFYTNENLIFRSSENLNNVSVNLYNIAGTKVFSLAAISVNQGENNFPLTQLPAGLYFLQINSGDKTSVLKFYV